MFSSRLLAQHAADMASKAVSDGAATAAVLKLHLDECAKRYDSAAVADNQREDRQRADAQNWQAGLGKRLDNQDQQMRELKKALAWALGFVIMTMATMIGSLLHTAGIIH